MHLAAIVYNLKKYLKFTGNSVKTGAGKLVLFLLLKKQVQNLKSWPLRNPNFTYC